MHFCVVSGGQHGAERGALQAAKDYQQATEGYYATEGNPTDDGLNGEELNKRFHLTPAFCPGGFPVDHHQKNAINAKTVCAIIALCINRPFTSKESERSVHCVLTGTYPMRSCLEKGEEDFLEIGHQDKHALVIWDFSERYYEDSKQAVEKAAHKIDLFLKNSQAKRFMVVGPREAVDPGIQQMSYRLFRAVFLKMTNKQDSEQLTVGYCTLL